MGAERPKLAFYYPGWIWRDPAWLKNLILFFDGVALLVPAYMKEQPAQIDPALVAGLEQHDLLVQLEPEELIDAEAAATLAGQLRLLLDSGLLMDLVEAEPPGSSISLSRLGFHAAPELLESILEDFRARDLASESVDGVSVPMNHNLRNLILTLLSQIVRAKGSERGLDLAPATDRPQLQQALTELLDLPSLPSAGNVFSFDAQVVGVDLSAVGIDEILEFRAAHGPAYRSYALGLRGAVAELSLVESDEEQRELFEERGSELRETGESLASISASYWRQPVSLMFGIGGAAWSAIAADPLGVLVGGAGLAVAAPAAPQPRPDAFSYICRAGQL